MFLFVFTPSLSQTILPNAGSYRSNLDEGEFGNWSDVSSWLIYDGLDWTIPVFPPGRDNDVFILKSHEIRLMQNEEVGSLYLYAGESPGKKLNLSEFDLDLYGGLHAFGINEDDEWMLGNGAHPSMDWIYPETGSLVFKGHSRTVVDRNSWSGQSNYSRFTVRFNPEPDAVLTVNAGFKANAFIIESGTVFQTVNTDRTPGLTSTFSFNIHDTFGTQAYGSLVIRNGARLLSQATHSFGQIMRRTGMRPASEFVIEQGGILELLGSRPTLDAETVRLEGTVIYRNLGLEDQRFLSHTFGTSAIIDAYHHTRLEGSGTTLLPSYLQLSGDMYVTGVEARGGTTHLEINGHEDQEIIWEDFAVESLTVHKAGGIANIVHDVEILADFHMLAGTVNFHNSGLTLNTSLTGQLHYQSGYWQNLGFLQYNNLPQTLTAQNATFPFFDRYMQAPRTVHLSAQDLPSNQWLSISYRQLEGVSNGFGVTDHDGTEIFYFLNSYFEVQSGGDWTGDMEILILANDMIVQETEDLRIAGNRTAAIGTHLPTDLREGSIWVRRNVSSSELSGVAFTIASTEVMSILPLEWMLASGISTANGAQLFWRTSAIPGMEFWVMRAEGPDLEFRSISDGFAETYLHTEEVFTFLDRYPPIFGDRVYYQIIAFDKDGQQSKSPVFSVRIVHSPHEKALLYPNPHFSGRVVFNLTHLDQGKTPHITVIDGRGKILIADWFDRDMGLSSLEEKLSTYRQGVYFIHIRVEDKVDLVKWIKK